MNIKRFAIIASLVALAAPTAATATPGKSGDKPAKAQSKGKAKGHSKAKNAVFRGTVVSTDVAAGTLVVKVASTNKWGRRFKDQDVTFTVAGVKKINVADTNADTKHDLADVKAGDKVHVQAKITKTAVSPLAARKLTDQTNPAPEPAPAP